MSNKCGGDKPSPLFLKTKEAKPFQFSSVVYHDLKLLEVTEKILEEIEKDGVSIKGNFENEAVLTTKDKTYSMKLVETTNLQLLVAPPKASASMSSTNPGGKFQATDNLSTPETNCDLSRFQLGDPNHITATAITTAHIELVEIAPNFRHLKSILGAPYTSADLEKTSKYYKYCNDASMDSNSLNEPSGLKVFSSLLARSRKTTSERNMGSNVSKSEEEPSHIAKKPKLGSEENKTQKLVKDVSIEFKTLDEISMITQASQAEIVAELDHLGCAPLPLAYILPPDENLSSDLDLKPEARSTMIWRVVDPDLIAEIIDAVLLTAQQEGWDVKHLDERNVLKCLSLSSATSSTPSHASSSQNPFLSHETSNLVLYPPELLLFCLNRFGSPNGQAAIAETRESASSEVEKEEAHSRTWTLNGDKLHRHYAQRVLSRGYHALDSSSSANDLFREYLTFLAPSPFAPSTSTSSSSSSSSASSTLPSWVVSKSLPLLVFLASWIQELETYVAFSYRSGSESEAAEREEAGSRDDVENSSDRFLDPPTLDVLLTETILEGLPSTPKSDQSSLECLSAMLGDLAPSKNVSWSAMTSAIRDAVNASTSVTSSDPSSDSASTGTSALGNQVSIASGVSIRLLRVDELPKDPTDRFRILFKIRPRWLGADLQPFIKNLRVPGQSAEALLLRYARSSQASKDAPTVYSMR
uniref:Sister chromatid cohesion protein DCC1 n=1 Tax=Polytomella parva TaxID=51329 RepID=A0A7S0V113_9CHLO|mmetsp:Transcript_23273/g.41292  ORF Transcript_23273/g.41292 Transcript_23273/m.41292 type:complete len:698 (+) Transcript_23273:129-2222(+)|eukprot:CAMPEP_0175055378 /NCGR_PEP_ID=MMETSP0052_2-20121109/10042_1 /TAXON_ID=51329 ORGANISM="Polytomella parva, Strain SAG 63-3" /NCGR_SAMPLE_ID=MMETSP0052_2 /ASSEMBLY_ACC=CAM_ASM_000194 /LENGTH=697 /DNA_ID=CAMNT_0016320207 /DNA_START=54 /DNA_END=2147 /DNA_ORIENTATION=+